MPTTAALTSETCTCYLDDDRFPCAAAQHEDLEAALVRVKVEAEYRGRQRARASAAPNEERDCEWPGEMHDDDLDAAAQQLGRPLSGPETDAYYKAFRAAYTVRMRVDLC